MNLVERYKQDIRTQDVPIGTKLIITRATAIANLCVGDIVTVTGKESCESTFCPECKPKHALYIKCDRTHNKIQHASCKYEFETLDGRAVV